MLVAAVGPARDAAAQTPSAAQVEAFKNLPPEQQQAILMPQGMAYMSPQTQAHQTIFQNGQIIFRAPMRVFAGS